MEKERARGRMAAPQLSLAKLCHALFCVGWSREPHQSGVGMPQDRRTDEQTDTCMDTLPQGF